MSNELAGKVYLVTGANTGIGQVAAEELARRGGRVFLAGRSRERTEPVIERIRRSSGPDSAAFLPLDLSSLASVREGARAFLALGLPLHALVNNAGLAGVRRLTPDGFEMTFGTNHLGPFLLTLLLLDRLRESAPSRIVNVASRAHHRAKGIDWEAQRRPATSTGGLDEYSVSKLANVLFTKELARRLAGSGVTAYALHPGVVATDIWRELPWGVRHLAKLFMISPQEGARTTLHCATAPEALLESGAYYDSCKAGSPEPGRRRPGAGSRALAAKPGVDRSALELVERDPRLARRPDAGTHLREVRVEPVPVPSPAARVDGRVGAAGVHDLLEVVAGDRLEVEEALAGGGQVLDRARRRGVVEVLEDPLADHQVVGPARPPGRDVAPRVSPSAAGPRRGVGGEVTDLGTVPPEPCTPVAGPGAHVEHRADLHAQPGRQPRHSGRQPAHLGRGVDPIRPLVVSTVIRGVKSLAGGHGAGGRCTRGAMATQVRRPTPRRGGLRRRMDAHGAWRLDA